MPQFITVKSVDNRCGLWEVDADHPGGEVFVREQPTKVARTPAVSKALNNGRLLLVDDKATGDSDKPGETDLSAINATAKAIELAAELGVDLAMVTGTLDNGRIGVDDVKDAAGG